jgi:hypothetical protein
MALTVKELPMILVVVQLSETQTLALIDIQITLDPSKALVHTTVFFFVPHLL